MARQLKLPMARVLARGIGAPMATDWPDNERILIVDMEKGSPVQDLCPVEGSNV